jgi:hypothetical protein
MDGLVIEGRTLSFSTKYATTGEAKCTFDIEDYAALHIVAVHTHKRNALYVNGDLVAEVSTTPEQQADEFLSTGGTLVSGTTSGPNKIAVNGLAVYADALAESSIDDHYEEGTDNLSEGAVATAFGGINLQLTPDAAAPVFQQTFNESWHWAEGYFSKVVDQYGQLIPTFGSNGLSVAGSWYTSVLLPQSLDNLYGISMLWDGVGVKVETSLDGNSWTQVTKGVKISTIPQGFKPANEVILIRVTFTSGYPQETQYFDNLVISAFKMAGMPPFDGRTVTLDKASIESDFDTMDYNENWGVELEAGTITIGPRVTGSITPKTIQVWAKKKSSASFGDNLTGYTASYTNGGALEAYRPDEWQLRTYVFDAGYTGDIVFNGTGQIGTISIFPNAFTPADVQASYLSYVGIPTNMVPLVDTVTMNSLDSLVNIYEYDWAIESSD